jgi:hypothetical protein
VLALLLVPGALLVPVAALALAVTTAAALLTALLLLLSAESAALSAFAARDCEPSPIDALKHKAINVKAFEYDMSEIPCQQMNRRRRFNTRSAWTKIKPTS